MLRSVNSVNRILIFTVIAILALPISAYAEYIPSEERITRAEFVARLVDFFQWPHPSEYNDIWKAPLKTFNDVKPTDKYGKQIEVAYEAGIIGPDASGNFNPDGLITRQDAAIIFVKAFKIPETDEVMFSDNATIRPDARAAVNTLATLGYITAKRGTLFMPNDPITRSEVEEIFNKITSTRVAPVQALPPPNSVAPRRYIKLYCPTPGATIHFTRDGSMPTTSSEIYTVESKGHINEMLSDDQLPERDVVYKAFAVKEGMVPSPVQTFTWHLYRPKEADFGHSLIMEKTLTSPAVYQIYNDAESVRAMAWYIEGQERGILFDALETRATVKNLKEYIDKKIAQKPYSVVIGHTNVDHAAQVPSFLKAGVDVYINERGWAEISRAVVTDPNDQAKIKNVDEGDVFHLGGCDLYVYALPGHSDSNIILQDKANGLVFSSDIYGCTRAGSADNVGVSGLPADLLLSFAQQTYSNFKKNGGRVVALFTGHDEYPLEDINLRLFEAALQQVIDNGEAGCSPTLRGNRDVPYSRTTIIGDMWRDGTRWIALKLKGVMGDNSEYLTSSPINYNGKDGYRKYAVLSNIEIEGGELVGTTVEWKPETKLTWAGKEITVKNALPNKFDPWTYEYTIKVPKSRRSITIIPTTMSTRVQSITLNGKNIGYQSRNVINVDDGTVVTIKIVAPDGVTSSTYTFTVDKE